MKLKIPLRKRVLIVLPFLLMLHLVSSDTNFYKFWGCYEDSAQDPVFHEIPEAFSDVPVSADACVRWCYRNRDTLPSLQFAGIYSNSTCVCAEKLGEPSLKLPEGNCDFACFRSESEQETCGSQERDDFLSVYELVAEKPYISRFNHSHITSKEVRYEFEPILPGVNYSLVYGDGTPPFELQDSDTLTHIYRIPGEYSVQLGATSVGDEAYADDVAFVGSDLDDALQLSCPQVLQPNEKFVCNLTILSGTNLNLSVKYSAGDTNNNEVIEISDIYVASVGIAVPQVDSVGVQTKELSSESDQYYIMYESYVDSPGILTGIELYGAKSGGVEIWVLKRKPVEDGYCVEDEECEGKPLLLYTRTLADNTNFEEREQLKSITEIVPQYNYFSFTQQQQIALYPGDVLAYKSLGGVISYRDSLEDEVPDDVTSSLSVKGSNTGKRHFLRGIISAPFELDLESSFAQTGNCTITATLTSNSDNLKINQSQALVEVQVAIPLEGFTITAEKVVEIKKPTSIQATFSNGSDADIFWDFGDFIPSAQSETEEDGSMLSGVSQTDQRIHEFHEGILTGKSIEVEHIYSTQGNHTVSAKAANVHNELFSQCNLTVLALVKEDEWTIISYQRQTIPSGRVNVSLNFTGTDLPSELLADVSWENDNQIETFQLSETNNKEIVLSHGYTEAGIYDIVVKLYNKISEVYLNTTAELLEKIIGLEATPVYKKSGQTSFRRGFGKNKTTFPVNVTIKFETRRNQGSVDGFIMRWDSDSGLKSDDITFPNGDDISYNFSQVGNYTVYIYGFNKLETKSDPAIALICISERIWELKINDFYKVTDRGETKTFEIHFEGEDVCFLVDYGDNSRQEKYGEENICGTNFSRAAYQFPIQEFPLNVTHAYAQRGYYTFLVYAFSEEQSVEKQLDIVVNYYPCAIPVVWIKTNSTDSGNPIIKESCTRYKIETEACLTQTPKTISTTWTIWPVNPNDGIPLEPKQNYVNESFGQSWNKSYLHLSSQSLPVGNYRVIYRYAITVEGMDPRYPVFATGFTYLAVKTCDLVPIIIENNLLTIQRSYGDVIDMNPGHLSVDPDDTSNKNFTVHWFCRRIGESKESSHTSVQDVSSGENRSNEDKGGCFGFGPGRLNVSAGHLLLNTFSLYKNHTTYFVDVIIEKDTRKANTTLQIGVVPFKIPAVSIHCSLKSMCHPTSDGLVSINSNSRLVFESRCSEVFCPRNSSYEWKLFNVVKGSADSQPFSDYKKCINGINREIAGVQLNLSESHASIHVVDISVTVRVNDGEGSAALRARVNFPPTGGSCVVVQKGTKALIDEFRIRCDGWTDPEDEGRLKYNIFAEDDRGANILVTSYETEFSVRLGPGKINLWVEVGDQRGVASRQNITELQVEKPSKEELQAFLNAGSLKKSEKSGDQYNMVQLLLAYESLHAHHGYSEGFSEEEKKKYELQHSKFLEDSVQSLKTCNMDSFEDMSLVANTMSTILRNGDSVGRIAREESVTLINNLYGSFQDPKVYNQDFDSPQQAKDFFSDVMSVLGSTTTSISNTVIKNDILPIDFQTVNEIYYDTDIEEDPSFSIPNDTTGMHERAIYEDAQIQGKRQDKIVSNIVTKLTEVVVNNLVPDEPWLHVDAKSGVQAAFLRTEDNNTSEMQINAGNATVELPSYCDLLQQNNESCNFTAPLAASVIIWPTIIHTYGKNVKRLSESTKIVIINLFEGRQSSNKKLAVDNSSVEVKIVIPTERNNQTIDWIPVFTKLKWFEHMSYHQVFMKYPDSALTIQFSPEDTNTSFAFFIRHEKKPTLDNFDSLWVTHPDNLTNGTFTRFLSSADLKNKTGYFYFGIAELTERLDLNSTSAGASILKEVISQNKTTSYHLMLFASSCLFFNELAESWETYGCRVSSADYWSTTCMCTHLTSFGSGFMVPPNSIDFNYVFANASFTDNLTIYMAIIVALVIYLLFLLWARHKDKKDLEKLGALPLADNNENDKYLYEILIFTGHSKASSTDSKVSFILSGDCDETPIRTFGAPPRKVFRRDGADVFVMSTPRPLGQLQFLRIWHDNSGKGNYASWYLSYVIFRDIQTGEKFEFIANRWFALEKDDGQIDRVFPVADKEQLTEFSHLFQTTSRKKLSDGHLWFSIFLRPPRSRFTRCQRVSSCMAFLFLSMLVNAMWYETTKETKTNNGLKFGPFQLTPEQMAIGFFSNLIIFLPSMVIIFLFRKARPRRLRPSRITEAMKKLNSEHGSETSETKMEEATQPSKFKKERKFSLPWWFALIAWFLCIVCLLASVFFLWAYGIQFGNSKTKKWLISLIISFFSSILITEPLKVFLLAMFMSALCKKVETDEDDADEDEEDPKLQADEQWLRPADPSQPYQPKIKLAHDPLDVKAARENRIKEVKMWEILREIIAYLMFLWILAVIGYGTHNSNGYFMHRTLKNAFANDKLTKMSTSSEVWNWATKQLMPNLRCQAHYNGDPPFGLKGFLNDKVNRIMGHAVMRQIRLKPGSCTPHPAVRNISKCSGVNTGITDEDNADYLPGWGTGKKQIDDDATSTTARAFRYQSAKAMFGTMFVGRLDVYSGGGYFYELRGTFESIINDFQQLKNYTWIDSLTRAILVDFSVYNAQVNLFGVVTLSLEFIPGGGLVGDYNIDIIQLLQYEGSSGMFIFVCEIVFILFIIYYTVRELRAMCKLGRRYFREYWNYAEIVLIIASYAAILMYIKRTLATHDALKTFNETRGNKYINLQFCLFLHNIFHYLFAFIVFIAILKFAKLLRFNRKISSLSSTLKQCANDLWGFGLVFIVFFSAFGQLFYLIFSQSVLNFSTPLSTVGSLFSTLLNKFRFDDYMHSDPVLGPLVFFTFAFFMNIILINLFLTIVIKSFETVKHDFSKQSNEYEIMEFIFKRFKSFFGVGRNRLASKNTVKSESETDQESTNLTKEFPQKVDLLLEHINNVYFDGKMDLNAKEVLKTRKRKVNFNPDGGRQFDKLPQVYNSN